MAPATIGQESDEFTVGFDRRIGDRLAAVFATERAGSRSEGVPVVSVTLGANLPNAPLLDRDGAPASLYDALGSDSGVIVFYRGAWCPYCTLALAHYQRELFPRLLERGVGLVAISPQKPNSSQLSIDQGALDFTVLSDPSNFLATALGILTEPSPQVRLAQTELGFDVADSNADATAGIPFPTVIVVDAGRIVRFADVQVDYTRRTEVSVILAAVDALDQTRRS
ncbi:peroxiredoxin-like family protein [soil metagenome]